MSSGKVSTFTPSRALLHRAAPDWQTRLACWGGRGVDRYRRGVGSAAPPPAGRRAAGHDSWIFARTTTATRRPTGRRAAPSDCSWSPCRRTVENSPTSTAWPLRWTRSGGFYGQPGGCAVNSASPAELRKEARRALPKMAAAFDDPANHSQARVLAGYGRSIGVDLEAPAESIEDLQARLDLIMESWNNLPEVERHRLMPDPSVEEPAGSRAHHDGQRRPAAARRRR